MNVKAFVIPNDPEVLRAVENWLESEGMVMVIAYPRDKPAPEPVPLPVPAPIPQPQPAPVAFPVGSHVKVRYNGALYYDPDTERFWTRTLDHPKYTIQALVGGWRKLQSWPPFDVWASEEDLEAA